jgi:hypothetical protein
MEGVMVDVRRPARRLFYLLLSVIAAVGISRMSIPLEAANGPAMTTVADVIYGADGATASGTLLISWPSFTTSDNKPVAAGTKSVKLGAGGAFTVDLAPNEGATPAGTLYTIVFQLDDGVPKTEYWSVPTNSPVTVAGVRSTPGTSTTAQLVSRQYVDTAVSGKASDTSVVHLSGSETIAGVKQFSLSPSVPSPLDSGDAVNKAYVDAAVANVGSGSYVQKNGDSMTGPLVLSGDPTAPTHAATRRYVDNTVTGKADLAGGFIPVSELGSGATDGTMCLKGNSTWGACGTSANAVSIQGVPMDSVVPSDGQVITYESASGKYKPKVGGGSGLSLGMQMVKYATDFAWTQAPAADLSTAGAKTVSLGSCPPGVVGTEPWYYVYVSGTGTAEAVKVTGGTCAGNGAAGTLQFTTANTHPAGYMISSASSGLQEALIAGRITPTNPTGSSQSGKIVVPPGEYKAYARVSIRGSNSTVDLTGSIVECYMDDACLYVGDPSSSNLVQDVTLINPRGRPMLANGTKAFLEVNGQKTRLLNVSTRSSTFGTFGSYVQVDDDQSFLLDGLDSSLGYGLRCDATFCGSYVTAPGPFNTWSAVGWLKNLNISGQCHGNGVDWQSGNTLRVSDSVVQGLAQFGIRTGAARGGYGPTVIENVYMETGNCSNPAGNIGIAGVIAQGQRLVWIAGEGPQAVIPQFANTGTTDYRYYVVPHHATYGYGNPLYAGKALTNGTGNITVTTPDIAGADKFDLLRVNAPTGNVMEQAPFGTGNYAVATNVARASACSNGVCTFTDSQSALSSYAVATVSYFPLLSYWPGSFVLGATGDSNSAYAAANLTIDWLSAPVTSVAGATKPSVFAQSCYVQNSWTPTWLSCAAQSAPPTGFYDQGAMVLAVKPTGDGGLKTNLKGRLNFSTVGTGPGHVVTLSDSNFAKTVATANNRPTNDGDDAYIGYDQGNGSAPSVGIAFGAPKSMSNYIGNVGDGTNWKERLTLSLKEFKTDVKVNGNLTVTGTCTGCGGGGGTGNNVTGDLTVSGKVTADSFVSTGAGAWNVEGSYGAMTPAGTGKSKLGFDAGGRLAVSENAGAVVEVAKKQPQEFTYTFFDPNNLLTTTLQVPSIYVNRAAAFHIVEVYCEIDAGSATINLQNGGGNVLSSDLACSTSGAVSSSLAAGKDAVAVGTKLGHATVSASGALHRMNVVVKYVAD